MSSTVSSKLRIRKAGRPMVPRTGYGEQPRNKLSSKKPNELFSRINANSFVTLVLQSAQVALDEKLVIQAIQDSASDAGLMQSEAADPVAKVLQINDNSVKSVIVGFGESDEGDDKRAARKVASLNEVDTTKPYLLLDVRDVDAYKKCHIITAFNYPSSMLSRMFNYESREMVAYKNMPKKLIIFYDDMESDAPRVASTLYERGYDNVYLLTGGLKALHRSYPAGLITGHLPVHILRCSPDTTRSSRSSQAGSAMTRSVSTPSIAKLSSTSGKSRVSWQSKCENGAKWNAFEEGGQLKANFGDEDLLVLRKRLEYNVLPKLKRGTLVKSTFASKSQINSETPQKDTTGKVAPRTGSKPWY